MPGAPVVASQAEADVAALAQEDIPGVVDRLASVDRRVEGAVLRGRPASVLVDEANRFNADLVIGGSRGHGPIASLLLGSVSAEVVDRAPCPMLIARTATISNVVVAADGSEPATAAASLVASWPMFTRVPISVVSVAEVVEPWHTGIAPTMVRQVAAAHARDVAEARAEHYPNRRSDGVGPSRGWARGVSRGTGPATPPQRSSPRPRRQGPIWSSWAPVARRASPA